MAAALAAVKLVRSDPARRQRLWTNAEQMRSGLVDRGFSLGSSRSPILPLLVGDDERALTFSAELLKQGIFVPAIRPPTVPVGMSRLRIVPTASHSSADVDMALDAFASAGRVSGVIG